MRREILVVDDDLNVREALRPYLADAGFSVIEAGTIAEGLARFRSARPALVVLDLRLPDGNGLELCREIREAGRTPVLMLTSVGDPIDRIVGLELGADDYVCKPFVPREVLARIEAVLRRSTQRRTNGDGITYRAGALEVDTRRNEVRLDGGRVHVTPTEFQLLAMLTAEPGRVFSREELLDAVWGPDIHVEPRTVDVHIRRLRKSINAKDELDIVRTVRAAGWRMRHPHPSPLPPAGEGDKKNVAP